MSTENAPKETKETLDKAEALGFKLLGEGFKDTLAYVQIQRKKKELESENIEWSGSTPLVKVHDSWKKYPVHDFETEFILTMRMRGYAMDKDSVSPSGDENEVIKKEDLQVHIIFFPPPQKGEKVFQPA